MIVRRKKKRKIRVVLLITALIAVFAAVAFLPVGAEGAALAAPAGTESDSGDAENAEEELWNNIEEILGNLDTDALDKYLASLTEEQREQFGGSDFAEKVEALLSGDFAIDYDSAFEALAALIFDGLSGLLPVFCMILSIGILCGILNRFKSSFSERGTARLIFLMSYGAVLVLILSSLSGVIADCISAVSSMRSQMQAIFPVLLTLIVTCGGNVSAAVYRPAALFLSDGIVQVITAAVFPLAVLVCVLHMAGHMNSEIRLQNFTSFFGSITNGFWVFLLRHFLFFSPCRGSRRRRMTGFPLRRQSMRSAIPCR